MKRQDSFFGETILAADNMRPPSPIMSRVIEHPHLSPVREEVFSPSYQVSVRDLGPAWQYVSLFLAHSHLVLAKATLPLARRKYSFAQQIAHWKFMDLFLFIY